MLIQERDGTIVHLPALPATCDRPSFSVEVSPTMVDRQGSLIDRLIDYAFTTLGARYVELRVTSRDE
ncbi:MAG: hypothetical protein HXY39_06300 [Chloroflexi bacterium]|nr:hypothetical protein [Chloroflexota bacterium]